MNSRSKIEDCGLTIDIPLEYGTAEKYQGTLGHKVNHRFEPETNYGPIETARYVHSVSYLYAVLPFCDVKCLCYGGQK